MIEAMIKHRSVRKYKNDAIPDSLMTKILGAGIRASTTGNMQVYSIVISKDENIRKQLWEAHFKQNMVLQAPVHLTFCADFNRFNKWCNSRKADPGYNNYLSFFTAAIDALVVAQNVCLAAESEGLGICYLGTATYMADKIIDILKLPEMVVPVAAVTLGYPDENLPLTDRLPLDAVIHHEVYQDYTENDIDRFYSAKEKLEENMAFVKENGLETLAQVFTDKRYSRKDNEYFSEQFLKVIKKQGF